MTSPEILYLRELVESGKSERALEISNQLLLRSDFSAAELAHINRLVGCARFNSGDTIGAIPPATLALKLARDLGLWDLHGTLCLELGQYHAKLRNPKTSRQFLSEFLVNRDRYHEALRFLPRIWANLGATWAIEENHREALTAFKRALTGFLDRGEHHLALSVWKYLLHSARVAAPQEVPDLLQALRRFTRQYKEESDVVANYLLELGRHALEKNRLWRAVSLGLRARELSSRDPYLRFQLHMFLSEVSRTLGYLQDSLGYALAARVIALEAHYYDLEYDAVELMHEIVQEGGKDLLASLDRDYLARGIDIGPYVSTATISLRRETKPRRAD